jgi:hypothetical protein
VTDPEDHRTGHPAICEAVGKIEKGRRGGHFSMVLMMVWLNEGLSEISVLMAVHRIQSSYEVKEVRHLEARAVASQQSPQQKVA